MITAKFKEVIDKIFPGKLPQKIAVAVSGGIDSMSLVFLLKELTKNHPEAITALIVDHKIRENSLREATSVKQILESHNIKCEILESYLEKAPIANIEANLRQVRYDLLNKFCSENGIKYLFVGHHQQDNAENFLIRLFRGSGVDGLAAIDYISDFGEIKIARPLLDFDKEDLKQYLERGGIKWFEDESNEDEKYLRNKIRKFLNSLDNKELINQRIGLASRLILNNKKIIEKYLSTNSSKFLEFNELGYFLLKKDNFNQLIAEEALHYLALALMEVSGNYYKPRLQQLENLYFWISNDKEHKKCCQEKTCFYGCIIEKYDDSNLIIYREKSKIEKLKIKEPKFIWDNRFKISIDFDGLRDISTYEIASIDAEEFNKLKIKGPLPRTLKNIIYTLPVFKKNGEIVAIPLLQYYKNDELIDKISINFDKKTKLQTSK